MIDMTDSSALPAIGAVATELHHLAVVLPEPANRHLLNEMILIFHLAASSHCYEGNLSPLRAACCTRRADSASSIEMKPAGPIMFARRSLSWASCASLSAKPK